MKMSDGEQKSLRDGLRQVSDPSGRSLWSTHATVCLGDLLHGSSLDGPLTDLIGRSVLVKTRDQLSTALALIELDGVVRRLVICPPDVRSEHLALLVADAGIDAIVTDRDSEEQDDLGVALRVTTGLTVAPIKHLPVNRCATEWVLLTSGTTGVPKMVMHSLVGLTGALKNGKAQRDPIVWGTYYDIRRYGGLQVFFRAILGGASFVIPSVDEPLTEYIARLGIHAATHVLGTPSHWRRVLMSPSARALALHYVRLSGEVADQAILDNLRIFYPQADIVHAYASTEAGLGFEVSDGLEGFPLSTLGVQPDGVELKIQDGSLRIRSARTASRYIGGQNSAVMDQDGFVDTGDMVELRNGRYYFLGRKGGIINVGGLKVHPEEVEGVINRHRAVQISHVRARNNPITGSIVIADVVLKDDANKGEIEARRETLKHEILQMCCDSLARYKVPVVIQFVPALNFNAAGKLARDA
jgi:acyl-CoA synthetase (AMP-forming)/AMP-acid ligase II